MSKTAKRIKNPEYIEASRISVRAFSKYKSAQQKAANAKVALKEGAREVEKLEKQLEKAREKADELLARASAAVSECAFAESELKEARQAEKEIPEWITEE